MTDTRIWAYHSSCKDGQIFPHPDAIPEGWVDSPAKVELPKKRGRPFKNAKENMDVQEGNQETSTGETDSSQEP